MVLPDFTSVSTEMSTTCDMQLAVVLRTNESDHGYGFRYELTNRVDELRFGPSGYTI